ncbi:uncharacterized protein LOC144440983 isoform X2 [Glandiceps talaboti]
MKSSSTMPTKIDETSCNGFCQHPACWASERRLVKHIPRVLSPVGLPKKKDSPGSDDDDDDFGLPSLKVVNMLDDYGLDSRDRYPSPDMSSLHHIRSSSLPSIPHIDSMVLPNPPPPTTSPSSNSAHSHEDQRLIHSAPHVLKPVPPIKKVEVHEVFDWEDLKKDWTDTFVASKYYVWCPSQKYLQRKTKERELKKRSAKDPRQLKTKNISGDLLPFELQKHSKRTKKSRRLHKMPSSGPREGKRSQQQQQIQMVEIGPVENIEPDGLNELLSLPRDILIEVLQHTKQSDLLSKEKIHSILQKILPQLQFHQDIEAIQQPSPGTSAVQNGQVLLNKKLTLLDSREKHEAPIDHYHPRALYYMDDQVLSRVSTANESEDIQMRRELEVQSTEYGTVSPVISETTPRKKVTGITGTSMDSTIHRAKITSISTQSLPPLEPGARPTRPFMYKGNSMDLTLGPVPSPARHDPSLGDQAESMYSEHDASSIHVTMPTIGSTDRSGLNTPVAFYHRSPVNVPAGYSGGLSAKMTSSPMPSEDIDGTEDYLLHAVSPSLSTHVPKPPNATPNTMPPKTGHSTVGKTDENWSPDQPLTPSNTPLAGPNAPMMPNPSPASPEKIPLRTITEANSETIPDNFLYSPSPPPSLTVMPPKSEGTSTSWSPALNSLIPQVSDKSKPSPIQSFHTVVLEAPSPEPWPQVNERDYYNRSPDSSKRSAQSDLAAQKLAEQQSLEDEAPAPPPPSPEPRDSPLKELDEENEPFVNENMEVGKTSSKSSLAPLQEEGEEEEEEEELGETDDQILKDKDSETVPELSLETLNINDETHAAETDDSNLDDRKNERDTVEETIVNVVEQTRDISTDITQQNVEDQHASSEQTEQNNS